MECKRIRDYGIIIGKLPTGRLNKISDVSNVRVGHSTICTPEHQTGVTIIMPSLNNIFLNKLVSAAYVVNGYGKSQGLIQIDELGTLESPIALTNTLNIGKVHDALAGYLCNICEQDGTSLTSANPIVCECNDSSLNKISERVVSDEHVLHAITSATEDFEEGAVGGGRGMSCYGWKGGIGSSSRIISLDGIDYCIGVLVQSNHGKTEDFIINGKHPTSAILQKSEKTTEKSHAARDNIELKPALPTYDDAPEKGSIIVIVATDLPVSSRQLQRIVKRSEIGIIRTGSYIGHGSGEIAIGFSTANVIKEGDSNSILPIRILNEAKIDLAFRAVAEATEEAILNSMVTAETVKGYNGCVKQGFRPSIFDI